MVAIRRLTDRSVWRQRWQGLALSRTKGWWNKVPSTGRQVLERLGVMQQGRPDCVLSVHGPSLFISLHRCRPGDAEPDIALADEVALTAVRRGVVMFVIGRSFMKFTPPLGIEPAAAVAAADVLRDCFEETVEKKMPLRASESERAEGLISFTDRAASRLHSPNRKRTA